MLVASALGRKSLAAHKTGTTPNARARSTHRPTPQPVQHAHIAAVVMHHGPHATLQSAIFPSPLLHPRRHCRKPTPGRGRIKSCSQGSECGAINGVGLVMAPIVVHWYLRRRHGVGQVLLAAGWGGGEGLVMLDSPNWTNRSGMYLSSYIQPTTRHSFPHTPTYGHTSTRIKTKA